MKFPTCKWNKDTAKHVLQCQTAETLRWRKNNTPNQWEVVVKVYRQNRATRALVNLMKQLNNFTDDEKEELNFPNCKYRIQTISKMLPKILKGRNYLFFFILMFAHLLETLMILIYYSVN